MPDTIKIRYTIEANWTYQEYSDVIEFDAEELKGLREEERGKHIEESISDVVNNHVSWGWEEIS